MKPIKSSKQPTSNSQQPTQNGTQPISNFNRHISNSLEQIGLNKFTANFTQNSLAASQKIFFSIPALHSGQNKMANLLLTEWNDLISFQPELKELSIPTGLEIPIWPDWNATLLILLTNMPSDVTLFDARLYT